MNVAPVGHSASSDRVLAVSTIRKDQVMAGYSGSRKDKALISSADVRTISVKPTAGSDPFAVVQDVRNCRSDHRLSWLCVVEQGRDERRAGARHHRLSITHRSSCDVTARANGFGSVRLQPAEAGQNDDSEQRDKRAPPMGRKSDKEGIEEAGALTRNQPVCHCQAVKRSPGVNRLNTWCNCGGGELGPQA